MLCFVGVERPISLIVDISMLLQASFLTSTFRLVKLIQRFLVNSKTMIARQKDAISAVFIYKRFREAVCIQVSIL